MGGKSGNTAPKKAFKKRPQPKEDLHPKSNAAQHKKSLKRGTLAPIKLNKPPKDENEAKSGASVFRTYIHVSAPEFREEAARQVKSLLLGTAPRQKSPKISTKGSQGLLVDATLRDIYVLSHGLRCADDIMIQLGRPQNKVGSFNRFIKHLAKLPLHAFAPRIVPKETEHRVGKQSKEKEEEDNMMKKMAELPLMFNNVRILTQRSILSNQKALKQFSTQTIKKMLTLRRGQSLKKRNIKYTDNPALFGKAEDEIDETLLLLAEEKAAKHQARLEMKQIKLIAAKQQSDGHLRNLFYTNLRQIDGDSNPPNGDEIGVNNTNDDEGFGWGNAANKTQKNPNNNNNTRKSNRFDSFSKVFNDDENEELGIPMNGNNSRHRNQGGLKRPQRVGRNQSLFDENGVKTYGESRLSDENSALLQEGVDNDAQNVEEVIKDLDDDELNHYIADRTKYYKKRGLVYVPEEDPIVQDFLAQREMYFSDHDDDQNNPPHSDSEERSGPDDGSDLEDVKAPDGTSINYNDFIGKDGKLDEVAFNTALQKMLQTQGFSVDDLEETSLKDVTGVVGKHVEEQQRAKGKGKGIEGDCDEDDGEFDSQSQQNHQNQDPSSNSTPKSTKSTSTPSEGDEADAFESEPEGDFEDEIEEKGLDAVLKRFSPQEVQKVKKYQNKLSFLQDEIYNQAIARGDLNTVKRILIQREEDFMEDGQNEEKSDKNVAKFLLQREQSLEDAKFLSTLSTQMDDLDETDGDVDGVDNEQLRDSIKKVTQQKDGTKKDQNDQNGPNSTKKSQNPTKTAQNDQNDPKDPLPTRSETHLKSNQTRLDQIQARLLRDNDGDLQFFLDKLAEYGEEGLTITKSSPLASLPDNDTRQIEPIENVFARYRAKFGSPDPTPVAPMAELKEERGADVRLKERPQLDEKGQKSDEKGSEIDQNDPKEGEKAQLTPFDDDDAEYPSDYTEGEGVEYHNKPRSYKKRLKKESLKKKEEDFKASLQYEIDVNLDPLAQLDAAMERIASKTSSNGQSPQQTHILLPDGTTRKLLAPSLLAVAWSHVGRRGTNASKRILASAKLSTPKLHTFIPPEYRVLSEKRLFRRARHDPILRSHLEKAQKTVQSMKQRFEAKDKKVKRDLKDAGDISLQKQPALMIPFRPHSDIPYSCMTISLRRNTLRVSISAIGARHQALHKRGYRTNLIETSLRESIANGCLGVAYNHMTPMDPLSPLQKLENDPKYLEPIRSSLLYLAKDVRVGLNPHEMRKINWSPEHQDRQEAFLKNAVNILGEEKTQQQLLNALLETRRDVLSNPTALNEVLHRGDIEEKWSKGKKKEKKGLENTFKPLSTSMIDEVVERMDDAQFSTLVKQLTDKNDGQGPVGDDGKALPLVPGRYTKEGVFVPKPLKDETSATTPKSNDSTTVDDANGNDDIPTGNETTSKKSKSQVTKYISKQTIVNSFKLSAIDVMDAVSQLPSYHQAQAVTALAAGLPFDPAMPLASPTITPIRTIALHTRDHTPLREVLSHTLSNGIIDADPSIRVYDPFCGSGTIVIESVFRFLGLPLQPLNRPFAFENWPIHDEYQYNAMMWEWKGRYQHIVKDFIKTFGITKYQTLSGDFSNIPYDGDINTTTTDLTIRNNKSPVEFPLFVGTDLRHKSIQASIANSNNAGVNYFTHFFQSDFQKVIYEANGLWKGLVEEKQKEFLERQLKEQNDAIGDDFFSQFGTSGTADNANDNNLAGSNSSVFKSQMGLNTSNAPLRPKKALLSLDQALDDLLGDTIPGAATPMNNNAKRSGNIGIHGKLMSPNGQNATTTATLPLTKPYLKGYTMFANIPWGVVDEKPARFGRNDPVQGTRYGNTTQQEPVEDLYVRMGRTLHDNKDLFRDVFVLSAHQKFEKLTAIGAQRQARENERQFGFGADYNKPQGKSNDPKGQLMRLENGVSIYKQPKLNTNGSLEWDTVSTFYNNGVKTQLLKLRM